MSKWISPQSPSVSCQCGKCVHLTMWGELCTFCFPHSIWSLSPFRNVPTDSVQALSFGPAPQLLARGQSLTPCPGLCTHPPRHPHAQGLTLTPEPFISHLTFIRGISATTFLSCKKNCCLEHRFHWLNKWGYTSYPSSTNHQLVLHFWNI